MSKKYKEIQENENLKQKSTTYAIYIPEIPEIGWVPDINVGDTNVIRNWSLKKEMNT